MYALHAVIVKKPVTKKKLDEIRDHFIHNKSKSFIRETNQSFRIRNYSKQKFIQKSFRTKIINPQISLVFGQLKPEFVHLEKHSKHLKGAGIIDYFKKKLNNMGDVVDSSIKSVKNYFSPRLNDYNNKSKTTINKYGNKFINAMSIYRTPLSSKVNTFLNLLSFGKLDSIKKKYGFDEFFHLALVCNIENKNIMCQKNSVVDITENYKTTQLTEIFNIDMKGKQFTLNDMLNKTRERMGDQAYFEYDMLSHNCQNYVGNLLQSEGLLSDDAKNFIYQDLTDIIKEIPEFSKKLIRGATDLDAVINKVTGGKSLKRFEAFGGMHLQQDKASRKIYPLPIVNRDNDGKLIGMGNDEDNLKLTKISDETAAQIKATIHKKDELKKELFDIIDKMAKGVKSVPLSSMNYMLVERINRIIRYDLPEDDVKDVKEIKKDIKTEIKALMKEIKDSEKKYKIDVNKNLDEINKINEMIKKHDTKLKQKSVLRDIKALMKEIKDSEDKFKIDVNKNNNEIEKLNKLFADVENKIKMDKHIIKDEFLNAERNLRSKQSSNSGLPKTAYVNRLNYILHGILGYIERFDETKDESNYKYSNNPINNAVERYKKEFGSTIFIFYYKYYNNPDIREYVNNMLIAEEGNTAMKSHYGKILKKWEDKILLDIYNHEGFINQYKIIMYIFNELKKYYPSIFRNYRPYDDNNDVLYNVLKTQSDLDRIDKFYDMYKYSSPSQYKDRAHQSDYEDFNKKVDISRKIIDLYDKEKMRPYMKFYALILFLSQYKTLDEVKMIYNDIENYKDKYITKKDIKLSTDKINEDKNNKIHTELKKEFKDELDNKIKMDKHIIKNEVKDEHNELDEQNELIYMYNYFRNINKKEASKEDDYNLLADITAELIDYINIYYDNKYNEEVYNENYDKKLLKHYKVDWDLLSKVIKSQKEKSKNVINYVNNKGQIIENKSAPKLQQSEFEGDLDSAFKYMATAIKPAEKPAENIQISKPAKDKFTKENLMKHTKQQLLTFDNTLKMYMKKDDMINRILNKK